MTESTYEKEIAVASEIARKAGVIMRQYFFAKDQGLERKQDNSPVTIADKEINHMVIEELPKHFDDGIIGEKESNAEYGMGRRWFCDPIDGTKGFVWGIPTAVFSLGLILDGVPVCGVVYDPFLDLMYTGVKGHGSFCNGERLAVLDADLDGQCVTVSSSLKRVLESPTVANRLIGQKAIIVPITGCVYKSTLIARGKLVGQIQEGAGGHDMAAVQVIIEEAGGKVTAQDGSTLDYSKPFESVLVSNGRVHDALIKIINP